MKESIKKTFTPRFVFLTFALLGALWIFPGCANFHVDMEDSDPSEDPYRGKVMHAFVWGLIYSPQNLTTDCDTETGINDIVVNNNYLFNLAGVLTLGLWMPIDIEYRCQAGPGREIHLGG